MASFLAHITTLCDWSYYYYYYLYNSISYIELIFSSLENELKYLAHFFIKLPSIEKNKENTTWKTSHNSYLKDLCKKDIFF